MSQEGCHNCTGDNGLCVAFCQCGCHIGQLPLCPSCHAGRLFVYYKCSSGGVEDRVAPAGRQCGNCKLCFPGHPVGQLELFNQLKLFWK